MGRVLGCVAVGLAGVWVLRLILGPWPAAFMLTPMLVCAVVAGWALAERRLFPESPPITRWGPVIEVESRSKEMQR
jgi:hypothetical protein